MYLAEIHLRLSQKAMSFLALAIACGLNSGCGTPSPNVTVSGKIVVKGGVPVDEGKLALIPDPPNEKRSNCGASIGTDGSFNCYATTGGMGIPPGKYKVVLTFASGKGAINPFAKAFEKYTRLATTPLIIDVPKSGLKGHLIELEEPPLEEDKADSKDEAAKPAE